MFNEKDDAEWLLISAGVFNMSNYIYKTVIKLYNIDISYYNKLYDSFLNTFISLIDLLGS